MRSAVLALLIVLSFILGAVMRGEADDAPVRTSGVELEKWVAAIEISKGQHKTDLLKRLIREADRTVPMMYTHIQEQARLRHTLTVFDVRDIREAARAKLDELEALLTASSIRWIGDGKLVVRATRYDADKVAGVLDGIRRGAAK
jgi:hypothetical protein